MAATMSSVDLPMFIVDAFSSNPFSGNPAAVCLLENDQEISDELKQKIANEMNLSETAFVSRLNTKDTFETGQAFLLRWFSPTVEVPLCGHATLATSAVLFSCFANENSRLTYETVKSGQVHATRQNSKVVLDFPSLNPKPVPGKFKELIQMVSCGLPVADVLLSSSKKLLVRLEDGVSRAELESLHPDPQAMVRGPSEEPVLGVILTVKGKEGYDFFSRYFAPWVGIDEDPVTGSAHSVLIPYWSQVLGKNEMRARQCSKRGGDLYVKQREDGRVDIAGDFHVVLKGMVSL